MIGKHAWKVQKKGIIAEGKRKKVPCMDTWKHQRSIAAQPILTTDISFGKDRRQKDSALLHVLCKALGIRH
jgi:hypothetical protein